MASNDDRRGEAQRSRARERSDDGYRVRPYEPGDREQFLALYETVFDKSRTAEWFEWRYGGPSADGIQMHVAERDGRLVGAEPFIPFAMRAGGETVLALQPADAMVHPDHRRNGLLTRMTERALAYYADREPAFVFNFPNEQAKGAYLDLGWSEVGTFPVAYRVQNPAAFLGLDGLPGTAVAASARAVGRGYDAVARTAASVRSDAAPSVERHDAVPATTLAALYETGRPERLHARRTPEFYRWRFANPEWEVASYTATRGGDAVAGLVACTQTSGGVTTTKVMDAVPIVRSDPPAAAFDRLVGAMVDDHRSSDVIAAATETLPDAVLRRHGFLRDDRPPLSAVTAPTVAVARPLSDGRNCERPLGDRPLAARDSWRLAFAEQDASS